jgi:predicted Zn-dependent protease with MMP-like domain
VLAPPAVPVVRTRAEAFDELVLDAVVRLQLQWAEQLRDVDFVVEDVPVLDGGGVPLGSTERATVLRPARIVIYRRPIETRVASERTRAVLVQDVLVEQVAELLGVEPETVDPDYGLD